MQGVERVGRRAVWVALGAMVVGVLVVGALVLVREWGGADEPEPSRRTLARPQEAAGYTLMETGPARRYARTAERDLRAQAPGATVVVGTYAQQDEQVVFVGFGFAADSDQGAALAASAGNALRAYFASAGIKDPRAYDPGPLGGALLCGRIEAGDGTQVSCGWAGDGILGSLRFATGPLADGPADDAAAVTVDFRTAAESRT